MEPIMDIHGYSKKLKSQLEYLEKAEDLGNGWLKIVKKARNPRSRMELLISSRNRDTILEFDRDYGAIRRLRPPRRVKYLEVLPRIAHELRVDFDKATIADIKRVYCWNEQRDNVGHWTKEVYRVAIKTLYKWLKGNNEEYPDEVKWIRTKADKKDLKLVQQGDLLLEDDILKLISVCENARDAALVAIFWDSGGRASEIMTALVGSLSFDEKGAMLTINQSKTLPRRLRLVFAAPYLSSWLALHPFKSDLQAPLWINFSVNNRYKPIKYGALNQVFRRLFSKAGLKKKANPHNFRHSRASHVSSFMTDSQMCSRFGWVKGSEMLGVYNHNDDSDSAIEEAYGVRDKAVKALVEPKRCEKCKEINEPTYQYCKRCGSPLDLQAALEGKTALESRLEQMEQMVRQLAQQLPQPVTIPIGSEQAVVSHSGISTPIGFKPFEQKREKEKGAGTSVEL